MNRHRQIVSLALIFILFSKIESLPNGRKPEARIVGGNPAYAGQFPFAAAITAETSTSRFFCGGALTGNDWVITAGHCVYNAILFTIQLGSNYLDTDEPGRLVVATSTYILHPEFDPDTITHDIGIIQFRRPIEMNIYLNPVPVRDTPLRDGAYVYTMGWGQTTDGEAEFSNELRFLYIPTISNLECQMIYGSAVTENMVCIAGNYNEGTCIGDNGSPLVADIGKYYTLVGVASFVSGNGCESTDPSGYTRTYPYLDFITNITSQKPDGYTG